MKSLVSILIPTYKRPDFLLHCLRAALEQTYTEIEVIISDDSPNSESEEMLKKMDLWEKVRYVRNEPSLGQIGNVNQLFSMARGDRLVLIHDDDWLLPDAVKELDQVWRSGEDTIVCYGLQYVATEEGEIDSELSENLSKEYFRTPEFFGLQKEPQFSALMAQIPNNGYMVKTSLAQKVGYSTSPEMIHACDFDFGLRLAHEEGTWRLSSEYVSVVRLSNDSILRSKGGYINYADFAWNLIERYQLPAHLEKWRYIRLSVPLGKAVEKWVMQGNKLKAAKVMFSRKYGYFKNMSKMKAIYVIMLLLPSSLNRLIIHKLHED